MINKLVFENLKYRWVRTLLSAVLVGFQIMVILTLVGLSRGMLADSAHRASGTGADIFLKPGGSFAFSSGQVNEKFVDLIAKQPHVKQSVGVLMLPVELITTLNGVDISAFGRMSGGFKYKAGGPPAGPNDLIVDTYYAQQHKLHVGDRVKLLNHEWHLSGIMQGGVLGRLVVSLKSLQELTGNADPARITEVLVKLDNPAFTDAEVADLNQKLKGNLTAISFRDFIGQFSINNVPLLRSFIWVITVVVVIVALLVVFLSMYMAVLERTREIGILKALGAKPGKILDILIREAVFLALSGCVLGILLSFVTKGLIMGLMPASLQVASVPEWWLIAAAIALTGALLGAIYPGLKAARQDAIEALAYE